MVQGVKPTPRPPVKYIISATEIPGEVVIVLKNTTNTTSICFSSEEARRFHSLLGDILTTISRNSK